MDINHLWINTAPPLYMTKVEIDPSQHGIDVVYGLPDSVYSSPQEEMIARSPIRSAGIIVVYDNNFSIDNKVTRWSGS